MIVVANQPKPVSAHKRQRLIAEIVGDGHACKPATIHEALAERGVVNAKTGRPFSLATVRNDLRTLEAQQTVTREIIGRYEVVQPLWQSRTVVSVDKTQGDYAFWDKLRRGKAEGFRLGALFAMPLTQIVASYVLGKGVTLALAEQAEGTAANIEYTNGLLQRFGAKYHRLLHTLAVDKYGLGDQYVAVNPDASLSTISPELVTLEWDDLDYRRVTKVRVETRLEAYHITDEYTETGRTVTIRTSGKASSARLQMGGQPTEYENLIGRLPVVHFANDRGTNEIYGRPLYEALYHLFSRYDDLLEKAIDGAELMGNPIPAFEGMENISETIEANATQDDESYTDIDGNGETRNLINWDRLSVLFIGKGGSFNFKSPGAGFTNDVRDMLKSLFYLLLDYTRVPEYVWGGAISSSRASAETQQDPFHQYIEGRRVEFEGDGGDADLGLSARGGLHELCDVWLRTKALTDPRVVVGPVQVTWPELASEDWTRMREWVQYLHGANLITDETAVTMFGKIEDAAAEVETAREEADAAFEREQERMGDTFNGQLDAAERDAQQDADGGTTDQRQPFGADDEDDQGAPDMARAA